MIFLKWFSASKHFSTDPPNNFSFCLFSVIFILYLSCIYPFLYLLFHLASSVAYQNPTCTWGCWDWTQDCWLSELLTTRLNLIHFIFMSASGVWSIYETNAFSCTLRFQSFPFPPYQPPSPPRHGRMGCNGNDVVFPRVEYSSQSYPERSRQLENWPGIFMDKKPMMKRWNCIVQVKHRTALHPTKLKLLPF